MKIHNIKINGICNPVGFSFDRLRLSYYIEGEPEGSLVLRLYEEEGKEIYSQSLDYAVNYSTKIDFKPEMESRYYLDISCGKYVSERCYFETGTVFDCPFVTTEKEISHPIFKKSFLADNVRKARLYITGLGLYEAKINGVRVGDEYLTPYCNDYTVYTQYQTYDVTDMLKCDNFLEVALGDGWYKGRFGLKHRENIYGKDYVCAAKLVIWGNDGRKTVISTDESWGACSSNIISSSIYDGEIVDETLNVKTSCGVKLYDKDINVVERVSLPVVVKQRLKPSLIISPKNEKILDFGQNFSGFVAFENFLGYGQKIRLQAAEILQDGCFFRDNLRTAKAEYVYTSDGAKKTVCPKFTFYGFRYMLVECDADISPDDFVGCVLYSDLDQTIFIETDSQKVNRLLQNCMWGQRSNFIDVPTDCPQRDERLGWTGDAEVFCNTACYQMDSLAFYNKYLKDLAVEQKKLNGGIPTYAPSFNEIEEGKSVWGDAATIIPWTLYNFYGDEDVLRDNFALMEGYVNSLITKDDKHGGDRLYNFDFHLGDWLSQDGVNANALKGATSEYFIAACYYYKSVEIVAATAQILGFSEKHKKYFKIAEEIKAAILEEYFTQTGRLAVDTQTAHALCIMFDIYKDRDKLCRGFARRIKKDCYRVKGGFVGATKLAQALAKSGLTEDVFRVLYSEKYPGWLASVNLGATTIWERWNALNEDGSISSTGMNSFNHYSFGSVAEAYYCYIAGIVPLAPAFKRVSVEPRFNYRLKKLSYSFVSPAGEFKVNYNISREGRLEYNITIPYGVEVEVRILGKEYAFTAGKNTVVIEDCRQFTHPFSADSTVYDLVENEKSAEVLSRIVPALYWFLKNNSVGLDGTSFRSLVELKSFFVPTEIVEKIDKELKKITV